MSESEMKTLAFPLKLYKPGNEWLVELSWLTDREGHEAICGLFHSADETAARAFYDNARRIISCWYVDQIWAKEGKLKLSLEWYECRAAEEEKYLHG